MRSLGGNLSGELRVLCDLPSELLFGPGKTDPCGGADTGEEERAEEKLLGPRLRSGLARARAALRISPTGIQ